MEHPREMYVDGREELEEEEEEGRRRGSERNVLVFCFWLLRRSGGTAERNTTTLYFLFVSVCCVCCTARVFRLACDPALSFAAFVVKYGWMPLLSVHRRARLVQKAAALGLFFNIFAKLTGTLALLDGVERVLNERLVVAGGPSYTKYIAHLVHAWYMLPRITSVEAWWYSV